MNGMKKAFLFSLLVAFSANVFADMYVWKTDTVAYETPVDEIDSITFVKSVSPKQRFELMSEVTIDVGTSCRLPFFDSQEANDYVWCSSNPSVAAVGATGMVTGVAEGEAVIVAVSGKRSAVCRVVVEAPRIDMEKLDFPLAIVWNIDTEAFAGRPDTTVVRESGTYNCVWGIAEIMLTSEGLYWGNDGNLTGAEKGVMMTVHAPVLYDSVQKVQFVVGDYEIVPKADYAGALHTAPGGYNEEAYKRYSEIAAKDYIALEYYGDTTVISQLVAAWQHMAMCPYASMDYYFYEQGEGYVGNPCPTGIVNTGVFGLEANDSLKYMYSVTYADIAAAYFDSNISSFGGWEVTDECWPATADRLNLEWKGPKEVVYTHGTKPAPVAGLRRLNVPVIKRDCPQVAAQMEVLFKNQDVKTAKGSR